MKKKNFFILILVVVLAFTLGMGTLAYYTKTFASNNNVVRAARFEVDDDGTLAKDIIFDLDKDPLYPGRNMDVYNFKIEKNNTEVPVKYDINVVGLDPLFAGNSPVSLTVLRKTGDVWTNFTGTELTNPEAVEEFKINLNWAHGDNDIDYQGKPGKININVVATQVDKEVPPIEPEPEPEPEPTFEAYYFKWGVSSYVYITKIEGIEGATHYESFNNNSSGGIKAIGKAAPMGTGFSNTLDSIYIRVYNKDSSNKLVKIWEGLVNNPIKWTDRSPDPYL